MGIPESFSSRGNLLNQRIIKIIPYLMSRDIFLPTAHVNKAKNTTSLILIVVGSRMHK